MKIFCDFDGTVTVRDNIASIMKQFGDERCEQLKNDVLSQRISIREGVEKMFALIPSAKKEEIIHYLQETAEICEGFARFIAFANVQRIPLYIISGGMDFFVYRLLEGLIDEQDIYCNATDFTSESIHVQWPNPCDEYCATQGCGLCKPSLIRKLSTEGETTIVIGDSITDLEAAKLADVVFARDYLQQKCEELNIPHIPFSTFDDITAELQVRLGVTKQ
ncbi:2-hydroxy-3-keto-5-methylthiopentenyl-1-phosphate phosphatase [Priestia taiwanensis]|uniref:2-hydroxy-3-keto-5-methylthiopentenyl-1-phosphate phosphatase n=1 Tax=Priestia taiwanensis TaxID=1347902 RepID=A0A917ARF5_9BACI|nr:2-hydroxy-3-keto-5-methylthiopentenyl-1-phosphate phosphatase [Priestia taiwanensis]MBM7363240.1 2-hydroxy-3-keto-5-methylthiopentenyl-1-phosphate phosphatase [Priestia taiwanensis]GGE68836.1 2-hydroxy-3-keto-5-methylthiopentenyl-1-phosphate phosphatase [Priestia taiwanensis]